ncbi:hypothetical protein EV421DRAFT_1017567 [Armillaria borealis]|uniref:Uncharacterized protein n=1 Tax=Armillaria borealis TaxID=47425 RepID=A0AA39J7M2_9AGAR|nr:hypothetical protein EV421DRAFT_1017567 [Armillaria borealis]
MAATVYPSRTDTSPNVHSLYPRALIADLDFGDNRYPSAATAPRPSPVVVGSGDKSARDSNVQREGSSSRGNDEPMATSSTPVGRTADAFDQHLSQSRGPSRAEASDFASTKSSPPPSQEPPRSQVSYALPQGASRRVVERYSLDDNTQRASSRAPGDTLQPPVDASPQGRGALPRLPSQEPIAGPIPSTPRHPALPVSAVVAGPSYTVAMPPAITIPLSASPGYAPPVSQRLRVYAQQPTFINQSTTPNPVNPVYSPTPPPPRQEEVCVECAMRDQDMADVDVTSPGMWERESDVLYEELKRREEEEEVTGIVNVDEPPRPRARGGRLTEQNVKIWLSVTAREATSRNQTLSTYVTAQRKLLEEEGLAHARAMQEAKQLDNRMRDAYSQLRRSAYDMGNSAAPTDDTGGVRIKPPRSPSVPTNPLHDRAHSREITLLENGMIVEHVDVRKEEREARERRRREERRARKSSRSSFVDAHSIMSSPSLPTDSGIGLKPSTRYSQGSPGRPMSVLTAPLDRPELPRAQSQASFSDVHSLSSTSPRRSRFFGFPNFREGWNSRDSLAVSGMSGSMIDMHVALQREDAANRCVSSPVDLNTPRRSQLWNGADLEPLEPTLSRQSRQSESKSQKKKKGLAKIWRMVTRGSKHDGIASEKRQLQSNRRTEDDYPLAPPPPLTYLMSREGRHASTPSLTSSPPKLSAGVSPPTAPSSLLPSPASSRPSVQDADTAVIRKLSGNYDDIDEKSMSRNVHMMTSDPDIRKRVASSSPVPTLPNNYNNLPVPSTGLTREKSLPPLPGEARRRSNNAPPSADRPQTVYTFDTRRPPPGAGPTHDFLPPQAPFRNPEARRQSFGGLTSRPNLDGLSDRVRNQTMTGYGQRQSMGPTYDEFGGSRRSLRLDYAATTSNRNSVPQPTKRKSRFGLSSLLGKKQPERNLMQENVAQQFPSFRQSAGSDALDEVTTNGGYATSASRHSAFSGVGGPRMSITSRKALEELVAQDTEFVAYRYPSNDQHLDLAR